MFFDHYTIAIDYDALDRADLTTDDIPDLDQIEEWLFDSICESLDGCIVEHDGHCPHGHPSWILALGVI